MMSEKKPKRPRDVSQLAKMMVDNSRFQASHVARYGRRSFKQALGDW